MDSAGPSTEVKTVGADDRDLEPGQKVGEYVVEQKIGAGGFGTVFRGTHPLIGKLVAIKVLKRQYSADPEMVSRFVAEARAVNQIRHRNIIDIFAFGALDDGRHYYVMEFLDGVPLDEYLDSVGRVPLGEAVPILRAMARALDAAHAKGIAHRDLKPENIFLARDPDGTIFPKLLDFGIAKLLGATGGTSMHKTRTGAPIGTPYYMSPEQCRGRDVDHRTDIYAFGCVAFKLLTGEVPFDGDDYMDILLKQIGEEPPTASSKNEDLPASVDQGIHWMLKKDPSERPPNLVTAVRALEDAAHAAGIDIEQSAPSGVYASATAYAGAQRTPSGVKPLPSRTGNKSQPQLGSVSFANAKTIDPRMAGAAITMPDDAAPARKKSSLLLVIAVLGAIAVGVAVFVVVRSGRGDKPDTARPPDTHAPAAASQPQPQPPPAAVEARPAPQPEPAPPPVQASVTIDVAGVPANTTVTGAGGRLLGVAPGPIQLDRSDQTIVLTFSADGYLPKSRSVVPSADGKLEVKLEPKKAAPPPHTAGKGKGKGSASGSNRDSIEEAFPTGN